MPRARCQRFKDQGWLSLLSFLSFLSFSLLFGDFFCDFYLGLFFFHGGGQGLVFNPGAFANYFGPREVFITRAFLNPIWTLSNFV